MRSAPFSRSCLRAPSGKVCTNLTDRWTVVKLHLLRHQHTRARFHYRKTSNRSLYMAHRLMAAQLTTSKSTNSRYIITPGVKIRIKRVLYPSHSPYRYLTGAASTSMEVQTCIADPTATGCTRPSLQRVYGNVWTGG